MDFIKNFFNNENFIIGLSGLKKQKGFIKINVPENYKFSSIRYPKNNYLLK